ncbi:hypothetical protein K438DRAFT_2008744 [Mycena galopus ATCC 62051]|nr:hypothetical protein K438DRAFT_2008744 [Mycena galopus ATCC 62051]
MPSSLPGAGYAAESSSTGLLAFTAPTCCRSPRQTATTHFPPRTRTRLHGRLRPRASASAVPSLTTPRTPTRSSLRSVRGSSH